MSRSLLFKCCRLFIVHRHLCNSATSATVDCEQVLEKKVFTKRLLKVAVIGIPNAGKSTFINSLMDRKVCATSSKVHTTRDRSMAVFTEDDAQIVFLDTPGLVNDKEQKKFNLQKSFIRDSKKSLKEADIIGVIHDVANIWTRDRLDIKVIKLLELHKEKPSFLVFNKVDAVRAKRKLLDITRLVTDNCINGKPVPCGRPVVKTEGSEVRGWPYFQEIFMVSALTGDGLADVKQYLAKNAKLAEWMFPAEVWTDQSAESVITSAVQAKLLDFLPQEIPYSLKTELEYFDILESGVLTAAVVVHCPSSRVAKLVAGAGDGKLRQITASIQKDLQDAFQNYVKIKIILTPQNKESDKE